MVMATLTQRQAAYHICLDMGSSADGDSAVGNIICATQTKQVRKTCHFLPANSEIHEKIYLTTFRKGQMTDNKI